MNIFIGGARDSVGERVKRSDSMRNNTYGDNYYAEWGETEEDAVIELIKHVPEGWEINVIGHSYGGDSAFIVAERTTRKINNLITIDPVSRFNYREYDKVSANTNHWINVNAIGKPGTESYDRQRLGRGGLAAGFGGAWNDDPDGKADIHIRAPLNHSAFEQMMNYAELGKLSPQSILNK